MGLLVDGAWTDQWYDTKKTDGKFVRQASQFRNWVTPDGAPGPTGGGGFQAEPDRYHLYIANACPWANRTAIFRQLKQLQDVIGISSVGPDMLEQGWEFDDNHRDDLYGLKHYYELYLKADPNYSGRVTVPILWDKKRETIVSNESSEIIRMLNSAFDAFGNADIDFYPEELRSDIDEINAVIYETVNNGVYRSGFATTQEAYEEAFTALFQTLDMVEERLARHRFLVGDRLTEADWRLFTTLVRFDAVYHGHFKCNRQKINDFKNMSGYLRDLYQIPGVKETVNLEEIKRHYYYSHETVNPTRIVPAGPDLDLDASHDRAEMPGTGIPVA